VTYIRQGYNESCISGKKRIHGRRKPKRESEKRNNRNIRNGSERRKESRENLLSLQTAGERNRTDDRSSGKHACLPRLHAEEPGYHAQRRRELFFTAQQSSERRSNRSLGFLQQFPAGSGGGSGEAEKDG